MTDLISLLSTLVSPDGKILIKGVDEMVAEPDEEEKWVVITIDYFSPVNWKIGLLRAIYAGLDYSIADVEQSAGAAIALSDDKVTVLMGRMRHPSLSIHGIEGAFSAAGAKTVIPAKVSGKFSIRYISFLLNIFLGSVN